MAIKSVGFQLKTEGKSEVRNDFAEVKASGVASVNGVADATEQAGQRIAQATDQAAARQISAYDKIKAAGLRSQINPMAGAQTTYDAKAANANRLLDKGAISGNEHDAALQLYANDLAKARAEIDGTAAAERLATQATEDRAASAAKLRAAIDPVSVAQHRFAAETQAADQLLASGAIGAAEHASALAIYRQRLDDTRRSLDGTARSEADASAGAARLLAEINPVGAAQDRLNRELAEYQDWARRGLLSTEQLTTAQVAARKRFDDTTDAIKRQSGAGGGLSKNQKQTLIYTASDIIGSSANGINPTQLLMQQGPQVLQAFAAEEGGLQKLRALINPVTIGIAGITAAAVAGAAAWYDYSSTIGKLNAISMGAGRQLGLTGEQLEDVAIKAAAAGDMSISSARDLEKGYLGVARSGDVLAGLTALTEDFAAATGTDAKAAQQVLIGAFGDTIVGAQQLADQYSLLTQAQVDEIAKMVEGGNQAGAQALLLRDLGSATQNASDKADGLAASLGHVADAGKNAWNWAGKFIDTYGRGVIFDLTGIPLPGTFGGQKPQTAPPKVNRYAGAASALARNYEGDTRDQLRTSIGTLRAALRAGGGTPEQLKSWTAALDANQHAYATWVPTAQKANEVSAAEAKLAAAKGPAAKAAAAADLTRVQAKGQVIAASDVESRAQSRASAAAAQGAKHSDKHAQSLARQAASMEVSAAAALDVADAYLKSSAAGVVAEARRKASTDATRKGIDVDAQMRRQLNLSISDSVANTAKTIAGLRDETVARKSANDNVAAGTMTVEQMNQALSDETALRPLLAAATIAQGQGMTAAYDSIMRAVTAYRGALADAHAEEARSGAGEAISASRRNVAELRASILGMSGTPLEQSIAAARRAAEQEADAKHYVDGPKGNDRTDFINSRIDEARADNAKAQASYILDTLRGQQDSIALSERELQLSGANDDTRNSQLEKLRLALEIRRQFPNMAAADVAQILKGVDAQQDINQKLKVTAAALGEVRGYGNQFVDDVLNEDTWSSWGNAGKTVLSSIKSEFIKLALLNPLKNLINGNSDLPTITSAFGSIGKLFGGSTAVSASTIGPPGNATGTEHFSGGLSYVNENGGEIMDLPTGTRIYPAAESRRMMQAANDAGGGRMRVDIGLNSDLLTATVSGIADQRVGAAAPGIAAGGAQLGKMEMGRARRRQLGRRPS